MAESFYEFNGRKFAADKAFDAFIAGKTRGAYGISGMDAIKRLLSQGAAREIFPTPPPPPPQPAQVQPTAPLTLLSTPQMQKPGPTTVDKGREGKESTIVSQKKKRRNLDSTRGGGNVSLLGINEQQNGGLSIKTLTGS